MPYKHTHVGYSIIVTMAIAVSAALIMKVFIVALVLSAVAILFSTFTVFVDVENARLWFSLGLLKREFSVIEIESCRVARPRYWSWGVCGWPGKWCFFGVSGIHSVEIKMRNGMRYYIGTDQPEDLEKAIREAMREAVHLATKVS